MIEWYILVAVVETGYRVKSRQSHIRGGIVIFGGDFGGQKEGRRQSS
jgi:hypothetical protein